MNTNVYELVAEKLIKSIENAENWKQPFSLRPSASAVTKKHYRGVNHFLLAVEAAEKGFSSSFWLTMKQANDLGAKIKKGSKSTQIVYYMVFYQDSLSGKTMSEEQYFKQYGSYPASENICKTFPRYYNIFNIDQVQGLPEEFLATIKEQRVEKNMYGEEFLSKISAKIESGSGQAAFYNKSKDLICLPPIDNFINGSAYYNVAFHELIHWTGHQSRLNRPFGKFGDEIYAIEELIAETGAAFLCESLDLRSDFNQHGGYLQSWLKCLKKDAKHLFTIIPKAQTAAEYLLEVATKKMELQTC